MQVYEESKFSAAGKSPLKPSTRYLANIPSAIIPSPNKNLKEKTHKISTFSIAETKNDQESFS